ncbi:MAG TPA: YbhN family protein [Gaiellaceae bacterium]|nr:YbhN family protein [Gaiellaceae bacterium]
MLFGLLVVVVSGAVASLLGWDIRGWFEELWDTITTISAEYLVAACALLSVQTVATAFAWYSILRFGYPNGGVRLRQVVAAYAASVAVNGIVPANLGTLMLLLMFPMFIAGATFVGVLGGYAVEKIFFTVIGAFVYFYLFLSVSGSFDIKFSFVHERPWATALAVGGGIVLIAWCVHLLWPRILKWWDEAKEGGRILVHPGAYFGRVFLPSLVGWVAMLGVIAVFLAAYEIPVTFHTVMRVVGGNSIANVTSLTPGGVGVTQAFNVASLGDVTSTATATAYSVAQQIVTTAWNILFGIVLMAWAFGWSGGRGLVEASYAEAKRKQAEHKRERRPNSEGDLADPDRRPGRSLGGASADAFTPVGW